MVSINTENAKNALHLMAALSGWHVDFPQAFIIKEYVIIYVYISIPFPILRTSLYVSITGIH